MGQHTDLVLDLHSRVQTHHGGFFVSRGIGMHPHLSIPRFELFFVRQGVLGMYEEKSTFQVKPGETLLLFPDRKHGGTAQYPSDLQYYWIHFTLKHGPASDSDERVIIPKQTTARRPERLTELFRYYLQNQEEGLGQSPVSNSLLALMMTEIAADTRGMDASQNGNYLALQANLCIKKHFNEEISSRTVAEELRLNPDYLGRVYRKSYGMTLTDAIHRERVNQSRELLLHSALSISEIAYETGFGDPGHFRKIFKRIMGVSAREYRKSFTKVYVNNEIADLKY